MRVAIIGAGIIGASCAYHLAVRGAEVTVVEREEGPAMGSTGRSAAGFRVQFSTPPNVQLSLRALEWYASNDSGRPVPPSALHRASWRHARRDGAMARWRAPSRRAASEPAA